MVFSAEAQWCIGSQVRLVKQDSADGTVKVSQEDGTRTTWLAVTCLRPACFGPLPVEQQRPAKDLDDVQTMESVETVMQGTQDTAGGETGCSNLSQVSVEDATPQLSLDADKTQVYEYEEEGNQQQEETEVCEQITIEEKAGFQGKEQPEGQSDDERAHTEACSAHGGSAAAESEQVSKTQQDDSEDDHEDIDMDLLDALEEGASDRLEREASAESAGTDSTVQKGIEGEADCESDDDDVDLDVLDAMERTAEDEEALAKDGRAEVQSRGDIILSDDDEVDEDLLAEMEANVGSAC